MLERAKQAAWFVWQHKLATLAFLAVPFAGAATAVAIVAYQERKKASERPVVAPTIDEATVYPSGLRRIK